MYGTTDNWTFSDDWLNAIGLSLKDYVMAYQNISDKYKLPFCNLYNSMGWNKYNFWTYFTSANDGTHPYNGFNHLAAKMSDFLLSNRNRY